MEIDWRRIRAVMSILGCSVVVIVSGITLAFSVFAKALKDSFKLSQVEVSFLASATCIGHNIVLPAGCFNDRMGPRWSMVPGCVFTCLGWGTILIILLVSDQLDHGVTVTTLSVALFTAGHGRTYFFLTGLSTVTYNVPVKLRPAALSFMENIGVIIPVIYPLVFGEPLQGDNSYIAFIAFLSWSLGLSLFGGIFGSIAMTREAVLTHENSSVATTLRNDLKEDDRQLIEENRQRNLDYGSSKEKPSLNKPMLVDSKKSKAILLSVEYQLIFWTVSILTAIALFYDTNTVFLLIAVGHQLESVAIITVYRGADACTGFLISICLYLFRDKRGMPYLLPVLCGVLTVTFVLLVTLFSQYIWCLRFAYAVLGSMYGMVLAFPGVLICDIFGQTNFGRNYGLLNSAIPIFMLILNITFSHIYDDQIREQGSSYCYGKQCFKFPFISTLVLSIISTAVSPIIYFRRRQVFESS